jgi:hypothetical protein
MLIRCVELPQLLQRTAAAINNAAKANINDESGTKEAPD